MTFFLRRCMRCTKLYGVKVARGPWTIATTHGLCNPCNDEFERIDREFRKRLDELERQRGRTNDRPDAKISTEAHRLIELGRSTGRSDEEIRTAMIAELTRRGIWG